MTSRPNALRLVLSGFHALPLITMLTMLLGTPGCTTRQTTGVPDQPKNVISSSAAIGNPDHLEHDVEEGRVDQALLALGESAAAATAELTFAPLAGAMVGNPGKTEQARLIARARHAGEVLWRDATSAAQSAVISQPQALNNRPQALNNRLLDDRPLYWRRLLEKREFSKQCTTHGLCEQALHAFERASRGATDLQFKTPADLRIVVSGFDPFGLDKHIDQSNPSGAAALALDGQRLQANGKTAEVQTVLFPVRFADFDQGMVEQIFEPLVTSPADGQQIDMLITISMGRSDFDLERFPGRRRSARAPDNVRVLTGANSTTPLVPLLDGQPLTGPEYVEFSLPAAAMTRIQTPYRVNDNRNVATLENGRFAAQTLSQLADQTAVSGSGGGYLSNEISYRAVRLVRMHGSDIAVGHIHTPRIAAFDQAAIVAISDQIQAMLREAIGATP